MSPLTFHNSMFDQNPLQERTAFPSLNNLPRRWKKEHGGVMWHFVGQEHLISGTSVMLAFSVHMHPLNNIYVKIINKNMLN